MKHSNNGKTRREKSSKGPYFLWVSPHEPPNRNCSLFLSFLRHNWMARGQATPRPMSSFQTEKRKCLNISALTLSNDLSQTGWEPLAAVDSVPDISNKVSSSLPSVCTSTHVATLSHVEIVLRNDAYVYSSIHGTIRVHHTPFPSEPRAMPSFRLLHRVAHPTKEQECSLGNIVGFLRWKGCLPC